MSDHKTSRGLKPLKPWAAMLVPPVLLIVAWNTFFRDRLFAWLLPKKKYEKYVFVPREIPAKTSKPAGETLKNAG